MPMIHGINRDSKLIAKSQVEAFNYSLCRRILDHRWFAFNVVTNQLFLKFLPHEFISIVVSNFRGSRITAKPIGIELNGTSLWICCGDECKFAPIRGSINHWKNMDFLFDFFVWHVFLDLYRPQSCAIHMYLFEGLFVMESWYKWEVTVIWFADNFVALALVARLDVVFDLSTHTLPSEGLANGIDSLCHSGVAKILMIPVNDSGLELGGTQIFPSKVCTQKSPNVIVLNQDLYFSFPSFSVNLVSFNCSSLTKRIAKGKLTLLSWSSSLMD